MHVILASFGSTGDINPFLAVGVALQKRRHRVTFIANEYFGPLIENAGIEFYCAGTRDEYMRISESPVLFHPSAAFRFIAENLIIRYQRDYFEAIKALAGPDTIVVAQSVAPGPRIANEKLSIPLVTLNLQPFTFWSVHHPPVFPGLRIPERVPYAVKKFILSGAEKHYIDKQLAPGINRFLAELGIPAQHGFLSKWLYSKQLVIGAFPEWFAHPAPDWPAQTVLTGFIAHQNQNMLSPALKNFLSQGEPPILFTAGSAMQHAHKFFLTAASVAQKMKRRALFITGFPDQIRIEKTNDIFVCGHAPYSQLLPQIEAAVHHGGIGTIAHVMAAAKPQILVPFAHDQPDNAIRVKKLGTGKVIFPAQLTTGRLEHNLRELLESAEVKKLCRMYSERINFDDSLNQIVNHLEGFAARQT